VKENPNLKPPEIQTAGILSSFRQRESWATMDRKWISNIKKKNKRDMMEPVGHDFEAVV
jgi:hypothetical protein